MANNDGLTIDLQGKEYRLVAGRVLDFRRAHPDGSIITEMLFGDGERYIFKATAMSGGDNPRVLAIAHGECLRSECRGKVTPLEKTETKAVGRVLALTGHGTHTLRDDEDGDQIADAPIAPKSKSSPRQEKSTVAENASFEGELSDFCLYTDKKGKPNLACSASYAGGASKLILFHQKAHTFGIPDDVRDAILRGDVYAVPGVPVLATLVKKGTFVNFDTVLVVGENWQIVAKGDE